MLELGKAGVRASHGKEQATAVVGEREWLFGKRQGQLQGRWAAGAEGTLVEVEKLSLWTAAHRFVSGGQQVAHGGTSGGWSPRPTLTATPGMPLHHQVFLLWLEQVVRSRSGDGSGAAFGGGDGGD